MKVVFTHGYFLEEDEKEQQIMRPYSPLGILYISAWLEKHGYDNQVFDTTFSSFSLLKAFLLEQRPRCDWYLHQPHDQAERAAHYTFC